MIRDKVLETIRRHGMLEPGDRVVVAVSGGPDSVALLHLLRELERSLPLALTVAHLDHRLRGAEAAADRAFVEDLAGGLGTPFVSESVDVAALARAEKRSLEDAGRLARRRFLRGAARNAGARRVALGHHRDDQAESVLLRLIAGSGRGGLSGIRPVAEKLFVRPLFDCSREEILEFLRSREIPYRIDASNADERFPRNRLRIRVLPLLREEFNPRVAEAIARTADILREEDAYLDRAARRALGELLLPSADGPRSWAGGSRAPESAPSEVVLDAGRLSAMAPPIARRVLRLALRRAGLRGRDLARARIDEVLDLARRSKNASLSLGEATTARFEYGRLIFDRPGSEAEEGAVRFEPIASEPAPDLPGCPAGASDGSTPSFTIAKEPTPAAVPSEPKSGPPAKDPPEFPSERNGEGGVALAIPGEASFPALGLAVRARLATLEDVNDEYRRAPRHRAYLDAETLEPSLRARPPRAGDRFRPLGAPGTRKLSDLWTDLKVPRAERSRCLVIESAGQIAWVAGLQVAHPFRITDETRFVAVLEAAPIECAGDGRRVLD